LGQILVYELNTGTHFLCQNHVNPCYIKFMLVSKTVQKFPTQRVSEEEETIHASSQVYVCKWM